MKKKNQTFNKIIQGEKKHGKEIKEPEHDSLNIKKW